MKKVRGIAIVLLAAAALWFFLRSKTSAPPPAASATQTSSAGQSGKPSAPQNNPATAPSASSAGANSTPSPMPPPNLAAGAGAIEPATATPPTDIPPEIVVQNIRHAITQFGAMFGGNPIGTNPEITSQLNGNNPKQINFIKPEAGMRVNEDGELVDSWGTPLFFHQLSGMDTEVRSAGPDKKMWTPDDLVAR